MSPKIILITKYPILILLILLSLLITPHPTLADQSSISVLITQPGLDFIKNLLVTKAISKITPTPLQEIDRAVNIPVIGKVHIVLSDINIYRFNVGLSQVIPNEGGITIGGSDVRCDLRVKWHYYYGAALFPISVSDTGTADIQVNGMEMGVALGLDIKDGSMQLSTVECSCHINDVTIDLDGGASWLYQGILDAFKEEIESTVAKTITNILKTEISKLGYVLQNLPKQIPVDGVAALNVTLVNSPFLSDSSLGFEINGLFIENKSDKRLYGNSLQPPVRCSDPSKMIGIALDEAVFKSALALYYNISQQKIDSTVYADLIIDVLQGVDTIPVACISLVISGTGSVQITGNNLAAHLEMSDLSMSLKWSKIGTLHMFLIQPVVWTMIETVFLPYVNARIGVGFPLPLIHGFMLRNAEIITSDSRVTVCGDVTYQESFTGTRIYTS
ncbi:putative BPI/LBP family protein At1g04970 isoform X2 [Bidens hawaiensis]|uniref:putative BPI/LBP family protein At1g04970 isoform X2 n=1 Tax=Bidens hawaiensis TaxID=980011 RepID=UPI0040495C5E